MQQFNLGVEQRFGNDTVSLFYVAALGRHIARAFPGYNAPPPNTAANPSVLRPYYPPPLLSHRSVGRYFDTDAFAAQAPGTLGNERSNQLYGPASRHIDVSIFKNFATKAETCTNRTARFGRISSEASRL